MDIETLAKELHEAGREVEKGATVAAEKFGEKTRAFVEWDEITEAAREGRRIQARYLLDRYDMFPKTERQKPNEDLKIDLMQSTWTSSMSLEVGDEVVLPQFGKVVITGVGESSLPPGFVNYQFEKVE